MKYKQKILIVLGTGGCRYFVSFGFYHLSGFILESEGD